jgi:N-acetylglucosaminyldiphosphoundecaprenol N-acetyl-beta-D-mannosaminyltransferase
VNTEPKPIDILGVRINPLTMAEAAQRILERARSPKPAVYVVKPYVEFLDLAHRDPAIKAILNQSWLSLPDSVSAQWATAYLAGQPGRLRALGLAASIVLQPRRVATIVPEKFGGTVFTWKLLEEATAQGASVYVVASPATSSVEATVQAIQQRLPTLRLAGSWPGELGELRGDALRQALHTQPVEKDLVSDLQTKQPDLILVGMGFPLQEELIAKLAPQLRHGVLIGEGGTFDYGSFGGKLPKAPAVVQRLGLEWLWRLARQPKRLRRQLAIPRFMMAVYRSSKTTRKP